MTNDIKAAVKYEAEQEAQQKQPVVLVNGLDANGQPPTDEGWQEITIDIDKYEAQQKQLVNGLAPVEWNDLLRLS